MAYLHYVYALLSALASYMAMFSAGNMLAASVGFAVFFGLAAILTIVVDACNAIIKNIQRLEKALQQKR